MSAPERRLCAPQHKVPCVMMHMAGLRQEQWGRRTLLRALGLWHPSADAVVPEAWVSARAAAAASAATPAARRAAWAAAGPLLVTEGLPLRFSRMGEFDMFAARLLLLGLLTRRRVVMPPIACGLRWMQKALEPRHLRGFEVGCGERTPTLNPTPTPTPILILIPTSTLLLILILILALTLTPSKVGCGEERQCIWLPFPHHIDPWCAGVDFLNDIDYRGMTARGLVRAADAVTISTAEVAVVAGRGASARAGNARNTSGGLSPVSLGAHSLGDAQVVVLSAQLNGPQLGPAGHQRLESIPLGGFRSGVWRAPFARQVERSLRAPTRDGGAGLSDGQMKVVKDCLKSLASSRE